MSKSPEATPRPVDNRAVQGHNTDAESADLGRRMLDVQNLLFGDARRLIEDRLDQTDDRHRESVAAFDERLRLLADTLDRKVAALQEEVRTRDREQTAARRRLVSNLGDAIKDMAKDA